MKRTLAVDDLPAYIEKLKRPKAAKARVVEQAPSPDPTLSTPPPPSTPPVEVQTVASTATIDEVRAQAQATSLPTIDEAARAEEAQSSEQQQAEEVARVEEESKRDADEVVAEVARIEQRVDAEMDTFYPRMNVPPTVTAARLQMVRIKVACKVMADLYRWLHPSPIPVSAESRLMLEQQLKGC
ncbi:MAG TPA: hypothetical protein VHZ51_16770 [Ktedonobacteraceae bacterium]|nr:hypothetical protein [Ktedonobacteraceae bacterium]